MRKIYKTPRRIQKLKERGVKKYQNLVAPTEADLSTGQRLDKYIEAFIGTTQEFDPDFERAGIESWINAEKENNK